MKKLMSLAAVLAVALTGAALAGPEIGNPAPDFTVKDAEGKEHSLSDFKGKTVVLEWLNHGCPFVMKHYKSGNMQELQAEAAGDGVVWLSVVSSAPGKQGHMSPEDTIKKANEVGSKAAAILLDEDGTMGQAYAAKTTPHMYVINEEGVLIYQGAIDDDRSANPEMAKKANNYVRAALDSAAAGEPVDKATTKPYGCFVKY